MDDNIRQGQGSTTTATFATAVGIMTSQTGETMGENVEQGGMEKIEVEQVLAAEMRQKVVEGDKMCIRDSLESIQGALLRMNRSIQSEGTFGIMKNNRWYKRIVRKGMEQVRLEIFLVSIGHNLYKYHNKRLRLKNAA